MQRIGKLKTYSSNEIKNSYVSIGFECLDRDLFNPGKCYDLLQKTGVKYARCQTGWAKCEKQMGVYDFTWLDNIVDELIKRGIEPWFNVGFGNPVYMDSVPNETAVGCVPLYYGEKTLTAWKTFIYHLTEHYRGRVSYYEIWNEPNIPQFWYPENPDGAQYAKLVDLTAKVIKSVNPSAKTIANVSQPYFFQFIEDFLNHVSKNSMDVFAYHAYSTVPEFRYQSGVQQIRHMLDQKGFKQVELWQGEGGYPSWAYKGHWLVKNGCDSERAQAVWQLRRYFLDIYNGIKRSSFFQMADMWEKPYAKAVEVIDKPAAQGILNGLTYTPKESYQTITILAAIFSGNIKPFPRYIQVNLNTENVLELLSCETMAYQKDNYPVYAYYLPTDIQKKEEISSCKASVSIFEKIKHPVLIDTYTADVFQIEGEMSAPGLVEYRDLPIKDYPLIITDSNAFPFSEKD